MPRHEWRCTHCEQVTTVLRSIGEHGLTPSEEEAECECIHSSDEHHARWEKWIGAAPSARFGGSWGPFGGSGKGRW